MDLSVCVIAKNAGKYLSECLHSIAVLDADVVVVVDAATTDNTAQIAKKHKARVFFRQFDDFSSQKNYAASQALHNWVLFLDADEVITPKLCQEITSAISQTQFVAFDMPRLNYIFGKPIYHTNWAPKDDTHIWIYQKNSGRWEGQVHEHVIVTGPVGHLRNWKEHHNYQSVEQFISKLNQYTSLEAQNRESDSLMIVVYPVYKFVRHYIFHLGFLDGWHGFFISYLMAFYGLSVYIKAWLKKS